MQTLISTFGYIVAGLYLAVSVLCGVQFRSKNNTLRLPIRLVAVVTVILHLLYVVLIVFRFKHLPMATVFEALTLTALVLAILYTFIQYTSQETGTGLFIYPVITVLHGVTAFKLKAVEIFNPVLASPYFALHTIPTICGYAAFLLALMYGTMYLLMYAQIESRTFGIAYEKLPNLEGLDRLNNRSVVTGFVLLTFGLITGSIWAGNIWVSETANVSKATAGSFLWIIYGIAILLRFFRGWQGRRAAYFSVIGGILLLLSFFAI